MSTPAKPHWESCIAGLPKHHVSAKDLPRRCRKDLDAVPDVAASAVLLNPIARTRDQSHTEIVQDKERASRETIAQRLVAPDEIIVPGDLQPAASTIGYAAVPHHSILFDRAVGGVQVDPLVPIGRGRSQPYRHQGAIGNAEAMVAKPPDNSRALRAAHNRQAPRFAWAL